MGMKEKEEEEKIRQASELKVKERANYELNMRLEEEMRWADEIKRQQEQVQMVRDREVRENQEAHNKLERDKKRKEEESKIANLELEILTKINSKKEEEIESNKNSRKTEELKAADNVKSDFEGEWYWDDELGWVQDNLEQTECQHNK